MRSVGAQWRSAAVGPHCAKPAITPWSFSECKGNGMETERLIEEVRKRPVLYDTSLSGSVSKELKPRLWQEVATKVLPEWDSMNASEQQKRVIDIQKRWRTLRDNFKRELKHQRSVEYGVVSTKRKRYKHYDVLSFLEPIMERKSMSLSEGLVHYGSDDMLGSEMMMEDSFASFEDRPRIKMEDMEDYSEEHLHKMAAVTHYAPQYDPDEMFFLSLIPTFKRLSEEQKSLARVKLTQLMHDLVYSTNDTASSTTTTN